MVLSERATFIYYVESPYFDKTATHRQAFNRATAFSSKNDRLSIATAVNWHVLLRRRASLKKNECPLTSIRRSQTDPISNGTRRRGRNKAVVEQRFFQRDRVKSSSELLAGRNSACNSSSTSLKKKNTKFLRISSKRIFLESKIPVYSPPQRRLLRLKFKGFPGDQERPRRS